MITTPITTFGTGTYTYYRSAKGSYDANGVYAYSTPTSGTLDATVQPMSGRDLKALPENRRAEEARLLFTTTPVYTESPTHDPDRLVIDGETWEVFHWESWKFRGVTFYKVYVSRIANAQAVGVAAKITGALTSSAAGSVT